MGSHLVILLQLQLDQVTLLCKTLGLHTRSRNQSSPSAPRALLGLASSPLTQLWSPLRQVEFVGQALAQAGSCTYCSLSLECFSLESSSLLLQDFTLIQLLEEFQPLLFLPIFRFFSSALRSWSNSLYFLLLYLVNHLSPPRRLHGGRDLGLFYSLPCPQCSGLHGAHSIYCMRERQHCYQLL